MIRTQIQFEAEQAERLRQAATRTGVSVSALVREAVDRFLNDGPSGRQTTVARALSVAGVFRSETGDVSVRHDEHLAEAVAEAKTVRS